jgi:ribonuclease D
MFHQPVGKKQPRNPPQLIADDESLSKLVDRLEKEPRIALDTEAASFHRYVDRVYLIQVSSDHVTALIDPLSTDVLGSLGRLLDNPKVEIVLHDADYDLRILNRDFGFTARTLFDTRLAAQLVGEPAVGLGALLEKHFQITLNKKLQRADWSRRPLTPEMIEYAADDTRYLPALRDRLEKQLESDGRLEWAREEFRLLEGIRWTPPAKNEQAFLRIKGSKALARRNLAVLKGLHEWREKTAQDMDRAPFRVLGNAALLAVARVAPGNANRLRQVQGLPASAVERYERELLAAVKRGLETPQTDLPAVKRPARPKHDRAYDRRLEYLKQLRDRRAREMNMDPGMLCPNGTLQAIARKEPTTEKQLRSVSELRKWQAGVLGRDGILEAIRGVS